MKRYLDLCKAVGIPVRDLTPADIFVAAGAIIRSQTLQKYIVVDRDTEFPAMLRANARLDALLSGKVTPRDMAAIVAEAYQALPRYAS